MVSRSARRRLEVSANGRPVGTWSIEGAEHRFAYDERWLDADGARPLSLSMPLSQPKRPHLGEVVHRWFDNLLPDDPAMRERLRRRLDARSTTAFDLLAETGRDCVGAVQLLPQGADPAPPSPATGRALDDADVAALLGAVRTGAPLEPPDAFRLSLAGAQEKTALTRIDGRWHVPSGATPTTHILKLPLGRVGADGVDLSTSVPNEWACLRFLHALGLPVAHASMDRFGEHEALVVERFDRRLAADGRTLLRLPQEDACQALGLSSHAKYEAEGGPGIERMMALWAGSRDADADRTRFLLAQLAFLLLAAPDGHAKNFGLFLERGGRYAMTPLYDVVSVWPYVGAGGLQRRKVALAMGWHGRNRRYRLAEIAPRHVAATAARCGFGRRLPALLERLEATVPDALDRVAGEAAGRVPDAVIGPIVDGVRASLSRLLGG